MGLKQRQAARRAKTQGSIKTGIGVVLGLRVNIPGRENPRRAGRAIKSSIACRLSHVDTASVKSLSSTLNMIPGLCKSLLLPAGILPLLQPRPRPLLSETGALGTILWLPANGTHRAFSRATL